MSYTDEQISAVNFEKQTLASNAEHIDIEHDTTVEHAQRMWDEAYAALLNIADIIGVKTK